MVLGRAGASCVNPGRVQAWWNGRLGPAGVGLAGQWGGRWTPRPDNRSPHPHKCSWASGQLSSVERGGWAICSGLGLGEGQPQAQR